MFFGRINFPCAAPVFARINFACAAEVGRIGTGVTVVNQFNRAGKVDPRENAYAGAGRETWAGAGRQGRAQLGASSARSCRNRNSPARPTNSW